MRALSRDVAGGQADRVDDAVPQGERLLEAARDRSDTGAPRIKLRLSTEGAVALARVIANESTRVLRPPSDRGTGGELDADAYAIAEVVAGFAAWLHTSHMQALRRLAPHVTGAKPALLRRHTVFGALPLVGELKPAAWLDRDGDWSAYSGNWARFRDSVIAMVRDGWARRCAGPVHAWGNAQDSRIARARGLERVACGDAENGFWALPRRRAIDALLASAVRR